MRGTGDRKAQERGTLRVDTRDCAGLEATMWLRGEQRAARVENLSAEGMLVRITDGTVGALRVGRLLDVTLRIGDETVVLHGLVCHQGAAGCGLFFPPLDPLGRSNTRGRLGRLVAELQRLTLAARHAPPPASGPEAAGTGLPTVTPPARTKIPTTVPENGAARSGPSIGTR